MAEPNFDAKGTLRFDIGRGIVTHKSMTRQVLLPVSSLHRMLEAVSPERRTELGEGLGDEIGEAIKSSLGGAEAVRVASLEALATSFAGELALRGFGVPSFETWGKALVIRIDNPPLADDEFLSALTARAIATASARAAFATRIAADPLRILLASETGTKRARSLLGEGLAFGEVLTRLQEARG